MASNWVKSDTNENQCINNKNILFSIGEWGGKKIRTKKISFEQCLVGDDDKQPTVSNELIITQIPKDAIIIDKSDFLIINFKWETSSGDNLNSSAEYVNSGINGDIGGTTYYVDNNAVGTNMDGNNNPLITGTNMNDFLLLFGGESTSINEENICINLKYLSERYYDTIPYFCDILVYGTWENIMKDGNININVQSFLNGKIVKNGIYFLNEGGEKNFEKTIEYNINSQKGSDSYKTKYYKICRILYYKIEGIVVLNFGYFQ